MIEGVTNHWSCSLLAADAAIRRAVLALAADRPDRLEVELVCDRRGVALESVSPGAGVQLLAGEGELFRGNVSSRSLEVDRGESVGRFVAYSDYEAHRGGKPRESYYQMSDGEVAERIACELGLESRVERTSFVHERLDRVGDSLRFLRQRARRIGFELAVTAGTLWFASGLPAVDELPFPCTTPMVKPDGELLSIHVEDRGELGRGGEIVLAGDDRWRPLVVFEIEGFGAMWDGSYRAIRCIHSRGIDGARTRVVFLERGADRVRWDGDPEFGRASHGCG